MDRRQFLGGTIYASALSVLPAGKMAQAVYADSNILMIWQQPEFDVRGLEIHSRRMWEWRSIASAFSLMEILNLNTLILHQDNLQDAVVWPDKYFPRAVRMEQQSIQGGQTRDVFIDTAIEYMRDVASEAKKRKINLFFEVTEIEFADGLAELHPEILGAKGTICPTNPFWWDFLRAKYSELFDVIPDLEGVIVSPGTRESKISIATKTCDCESCSTTTASEWYENLIRSMFEPIESRGKTLVVRDFAYTKTDQTLVMDAAQRVSTKIVASLKHTPHDFYITFPNNPRIGHMGKMRQWIEFDAWGQFYGCGLFPCSIVEDLERRLTYDRANGATGAWFRTDLEGMTDESTFNSFNLLNLIAGALLSQQVTQGLDNCYAAWMQIGLLDSLIPNSVQPDLVPVPREYLPRLRDFMKASYAIAKKTFYVRGHLFYKNGRFPDTVDYAFFNMMVFAGLEDWEPEANQRIEPTEENIAAIIAEKDAALAEVQKLPEILEVDSLPISAQFKAHLATVLSLYTENVRGFRLCAIGCFRAKQASITGQSDHVQLAMQAAEDILQYRERIGRFLDDKYFPWSVHRAFRLDYLDSLIHSIRDICAPLAKAESL